MQSTQHQAADIAASSAERPKLTRSKGGCTTCREKRIKCGEEKPACDQCKLAGRHCTYQAGTKVARIEKARPLQPRDSPIAIRPRGTDRSTSPSHNGQNPNSGYSQQQSSSNSFQSTHKTTSEIGSSHREGSQHSGQVSADEALHKGDNVQYLKPDFDIGINDLSIAAGLIAVPMAMSLEQFCKASSRKDKPIQDSASLSFLRNTYLARFTTGMFTISGFSLHSIAIMLDEMDSSAKMKMNEPGRLQDPLSNSCFQEAYVAQQRDSIHASIHPIRAWWCALFLLIMSLELRMFGFARRHQTMAIACHRQADVAQLVRNGVPEDQRKILLFLTESTFRYCLTMDHMTGRRSTVMTNADLLESQLPLDIVFRSTMTLKSMALDVITTLASIANNSDRVRAGKSVDTMLWEVYNSERLIKDNAGPLRQLNPGESPFGYEAYASVEWAHAALGLIFIKLLLSNIVSQFRREELIRNYFSILGYLILLSQQGCTLDILSVMISVAMLNKHAERQWAVQALRKGVSHGISFLTPLDVFEECVFKTWQVMDAREGSGVTRDYEILSTVQQHYRAACE